MAVVHTRQATAAGLQTAAPRPLASRACRIVQQAGDPTEASSSSRVHLLQPSQQVSSHRPAVRTAATAADEAAPAKLAWWEKDMQPNMKDVSGVQQLVDELADNRDKLIIVEFYASWCNACKALYPKICKMMAEHLDDVLFLKVEYDANKDMCKTMGIKVLPQFLFFRGAEGKVEQFTCTISKIQRLKDAIEMYSSPFCSLEEVAPLAEFPDIRPHPESSANGQQQKAPWAADPQEVAKLPAGSDQPTVLQEAQS